jgi:DNA-binding transcriptional MerR regulator
VFNTHINVKVNCKLEHMRIGELAERTGVSRRLLRYYEEQGLLVPSRALNGYREYGEPHVDVVLQIAGLLDAGLPTRIIAQLLPCLDQPQTIYVPDVTPEMLATLRREQGRFQGSQHQVEPQREQNGVMMLVSSTWPPCS